MPYASIIAQDPHALTASFIPVKAAAEKSDELYQGRCVVHAKLTPEWFQELLCFGEPLNARELQERVIQTFHNEITYLTPHQEQALRLSLAHLFDKRVTNQRPYFFLGDEEGNNKVQEAKVAGLGYATLAAPPKQQEVAILYVEDRGVLAGESTAWGQVLYTLNNLFRAMQGREDLAPFFVDAKQPQSLDDWIRLIANVRACESRGAQSLMKHGATDENVYSRYSELLPSAYRDFISPLVVTANTRLFSNQTPSLTQLNLNYHKKIQDLFTSSWGQIGDLPEGMFAKSLDYNAACSTAKGIRNGVYPCYTDRGDGGVGIDLVEFVHAKHDPRGLYTAAEYLAEGAWTRNSSLHRYSQEEKRVFLENVKGFLQNLPALVQESKNLREAYRGKALPAMPSDEQWQELERAFMNSEVIRVDSNSSVESVASSSSYSTDSLSHSDEDTQLTEEPEAAGWNQWMADVSALAYSLEDAGDKGGLRDHYNFLQEIYDKDQAPRHFRSALNNLLQQMSSMVSAETPASREEWQVWQEKINTRIDHALEVLEQNAADEDALQEWSSIRHELSRLYTHAPPDVQEFISEAYHRDAPNIGT